jgi:predicted dehydrogenase
LNIGSKIVARKQIKFGIIGCGLMGREFASAAARWCHLKNQQVEPRIIAVCDPNPDAVKWFRENVPGLGPVTADYKELLAYPEVEAVYAAVPHNLHAELYVDVITAGKHLLGEKPFGIDQPANRRILSTIAVHPNILVRCSSEIPFYPGAYAIAEMVRDNRFGRIIEVEAGFWHSSDLDPQKPINWKRRIATNGEYGCMGDLGLHVLHLPLRFGWMPKSVRALLSKIFETRPDGKGGVAPCETWDNATLACAAAAPTMDYSFPMILSTKRIAPGHSNTWFIRIAGTELSAEFSTKDPKRLAVLPYVTGGEQAWHITDLHYKSAYETITGNIFEFGFSDSILQMWAAFCDELAHGRDNMRQPFYCATPNETAASHTLFTSALESQKTGRTVHTQWE